MRRIDIFNTIKTMLCSGEYGCITSSEISEGSLLLQDLDIDSLTMISFFCDLENQFDCIISDSLLLIESSVTIGNIVDYILVADKSSGD